MAGKIGIKAASNTAVLRGASESRAFASRGWVDRYSMLIVLIGLVIAAAALSPTFLNPNNLLNISQQVALNGLMSVGMTLTILTGGIDLSVGSTLALGSVLVAGTKDLGTWAILIALLGGAFVGMLNGVTITTTRVHPFIVTLGTMSAIRGLALIYSSDHPIGGTPQIVQAIAQGDIGQVPIQTIILAFVFVLAFLFLRQTRIGTHIYAVGSNEEAARLSGVQVNLVKIIVYTLSGILAALAGVIIAGHLNVGDPQFGTANGGGAELNAIAASVIGGIYLMGGRGSIGGTLLGVLIIGVINNLLNLLNIPGEVQFIVVGVIIVTAVAIQRFQE